MFPSFLAFIQHVLNLLMGVHILWISSSFGLCSDVNATLYKCFSLTLSVSEIIATVSWWHYLTQATYIGSVVTLLVLMVCYHWSKSLLSLHSSTMEVNKVIGMKNVNVVSALLERLYKQSLNPDFCSCVTWTQRVILLYDAHENWFSTVMLYVVWCS